MQEHGLKVKNYVDLFQNESGYRWVYYFVVPLAIVGFVSFPFDIAISRWFLLDKLPGEIRGLIHKVEFFGHAYGILGILFTIYLVDHQRRRQIPRIALAAMSAGLTVNLFKLLIHRSRPCDYSFVEGTPTFLGLSFQHTTSLDMFFDSGFQSFPSGHTATAVAFAIGLGYMYPTARQWFLSLAALVALSRVEGGAHFLSDVCFGAILGIVAGRYFYGDSRISRALTRREDAVPLTMKHCDRDQKSVKSSAA